VNIAFITSEAVPYAKTGGLADVSGALPFELEKLGHDVILIMPYYQMIKKKNLPVRKIDGADVYVTKAGKNVSFYFISNEEYYDRPELYGTPQGDYPDNAVRFGYFCKQVLELLPKINFHPNIIHTNDWQSAMIPFYLKTTHAGNEFYKGVKTVITIHNMAYQGLFDPAVLPELGLGWDVFKPHGGIEYYGKINFLKAGLISADAISTVSEKYSREIQTEEYGCGLEGVLREEGGHVFGILNGIDYAQWNPEVDEFIAKKYSAGSMGGKYECRKDLLKEFGINASDTTPIIGIISRLADQKGFDIISEAIEELAVLDLRIVLLGTGDEKYHKIFSEIKEKYPDHFGIKIAFNNVIAHKIEAGSDMFLMPSRYEPCGLNQIYSLKYGTVPIVRATGGLDDTIENFNTESTNGNGFKFNDYNAGALLDTIKRSIRVFRDKKLWNKLMQNGMSQDFSWQNSAEKYIQMYKKI
jgi:starch synthase